MLIFLALQGDIQGAFAQQLPIRGVDSALCIPYKVLDFSAEAGFPRVVGRVLACSFKLCGMDIDRAAEFFDSTAFCCALKGGLTVSRLHGDGHAEGASQRVVGVIQAAA